MLIKCFQIGYGAGKRQSRKVHDLACAILQVAQMMDPKYLKDPLGEDEKEKKKRLKEEERKKKVNKSLGKKL